MEELRRGGRTALDTVVAPRHAFESIRNEPKWYLAFLILITLFTIGYILQRPASEHASLRSLRHMLATNAMLANLTDSQRSEILEKAQHHDSGSNIARALMEIVGVAVALLLDALLLFAAVSVSHGSPRFSIAWAASVNIGIATIGLSSLVLGAIAALRGPDSFAASIDLARAIPSLGMFLPGVTGGAAAFFTTLNVFVLWGLFLNAQALRWACNVRGSIVWIGPVAVTLLLALISAWGASFAG
ncbi:MAG: hypothetical protein WCC70_14930 [Candidatus Aquilonibacter sp.]